MHAGKTVEGYNVGKIESVMGAGGVAHASVAIWDSLPIGLWPSPALGYPLPQQGRVTGGTAFRPFRPLLFRHAPFPKRTMGIVFKKIFRSNSSDQESM
jgi:hypothetical protein